MKNKYMSYLMALGHACADLNQGSLSAVLPFLIAAHHFSYSKASTLVLIANLIGSLVQPLFGHLADRKNYPWLMVLALFLAGGGMALTGLTDNYFILSLSVMISGFGIAMFHPQAARLVHLLSDEGNKSQSIAIFSFGGNLGFTLGPILTTTAIGYFGLKGSLIFLLPQVLIGFILLSKNQQLKFLKDKVDAEKTVEQEVAPSQWLSFAKLCFAVFGRSIIFYGLNTFLALYWIQELGLDKVTGNLILSVFFAISAFSTLLGGRLADRFGPIKMIRLAFTVLFPSLLLLSVCKSLLLASILLFPLALGTSLSYSPMVVLGQEYLPKHVGLASGVTLGLAVSIGGLFAPVLGRLADTHGLIASFQALALISVIPLLASVFLDRVKTVKNPS